MPTRSVVLALVVALAAVLSLAPLGASAKEGDPVDPAAEAQNFVKQTERAQEYNQPGSLTDQLTQAPQAGIDGISEQGQGAGRLFVSDLCWSKSFACGGDPRLAHWQDDGFGQVRRVLYTARNGSTLSGHVWATRSGPAKRPL